jgi:hypothetical protein
MLLSFVHRRSVAGTRLLSLVALGAALACLNPRSGEESSTRTVSIRPQSGLTGLLAFPLVVMPWVWECMQH